MISWPLFDDAGEPSPELKQLQQLVTAIQSEID
jgi:hypothetical protein